MVTPLSVAVEVLGGCEGSGVSSLMISWIERTERLSSSSWGSENTLKVLWVEEEAKDISGELYRASRSLLPIVNKLSLRRQIKRYSSTKS